MKHAWVITAHARQRWVERVDSEKADPTPAIRQKLDLARPLPPRYAARIHSLCRRENTYLYLRYGRIIFVLGGRHNATLITVLVM